MAQITCSECNSSISDKAAACPQCGCPRQPADSPDSTAGAHGPWGGIATLKRGLILAAAVAAIHFAAVTWLWARWTAEIEHAFQSAGPELIAQLEAVQSVGKPILLETLTFPIGHIGIYQSGGDLPYWAILAQGAFWAFWVFLAYTYLAGERRWKLRKEYER